MFDIQQSADGLELQAQVALLTEKATHTIEVVAATLTELWGIPPEAFKRVARNDGSGMDLLLVNRLGNTRLVYTVFTKKDTEMVEVYGEWRIGPEALAILS